MATLLPNGKQQFQDINGDPLAGGFVYFYIPNTTVFKTTWQDSSQTILNTNPIVLDMAGQAVIYGEGVYRQVVTDSAGNLIWDQLTGSTESSLYAGSATGSSDVIVLTLSPPLTSYVDGTIIEFKAIANNTTSTPTVNVNTLGAKTIILPSGASLYAGAIQTGGIYQIAYSSTIDKFQLLGVARGQAGNENLNADIIDNGSGSLTANEPMIVKSDSYSILNTDRNSLVLFGLSAAATCTLPDSSVVGDGWRVKVLNAPGSSVSLTIAAVGGLFYGPNLSGVANFTLAPGESAIFTADTTLWLLSATTRQSIGIQGAYRNMRIVTADGGTGPVISASQVVLADSNGRNVRLSTVNATASIDTGSIASATWYYVWAFYNSATNVTTARYSLSATAPTAPAGSTFSARLGAVRTKSGSAVFIGTTQAADTVQYTTAPLPVIASGAVGTYLTSFAAVALSNFVPPTASRIKFMLQPTATTTNAGAVAPNNTYSAAANSTTSAPVWSLASGSSSPGLWSNPAEFIIESTVMYAATQANTQIVAFGWSDNL